MIDGGLAVIQRWVLLLKVAEVVNLSDFDLKKDLTVYNKFHTFDIKLGLQTIIFNFVGRFFVDCKYSRYSL